MTKQLLRDAVDLDVPTYISTVNYPLGVVGALTREFEVALKQTLRPTRVDVDAEVNGMTCDVLLWLGEYRVVLFLMHKDKPLPQISGWSLKDVRAGVMEIDLTAVEKSYGELKVGDAFKATIAEFLQKNLESKRWIYHPQEERLKQGLLEQLEHEWNNQSSRNVAHSQSSHASRSAAYSASRGVAARLATDVAQAERKVLYACRLCGQEFVGLLPGTPSCPCCGRSASLFAAELKTLE